MIPLLILLNAKRGVPIMADMSEDSGKTKVRAEVDHVIAKGHHPQIWLSLNIDQTSLMTNSIVDALDGTEEIA